MEGKTWTVILCSGFILWVLCIAGILIFTEPSTEEPKPCEMKIYQHMDEYHINTSCGHIVVDRCPFCDKSVEIVVE